MKNENDIGSYLPERVVGCESTPIKSAVDVGDNDYYSKPAAQRTFEKKLIALAQDEEYGGQIWFDCLLHVPYRSVQKIGGGTFYNRNVLRIRPDFFLPDVGMVLEIDGVVHAREDQMKIDARVERALAGIGVCVLRFPNSDLYSMDSCLRLFRDMRDILSDVSRRRSRAQKKLILDELSRGDEIAKRNYRVSAQLLEKHERHDTAGIQYNVPLRYRGGYRMIFRKRPGKKVIPGIELLISMPSASHDNYRRIKVRDDDRLLEVERYIYASFFSDSGYAGDGSFVCRNRAVEKCELLGNCMRDLGKKFPLFYQLNDFNFEIRMVGTSLTYSRNSYPILVDAIGGSVPTSLPDFTSFNEMMKAIKGGDTEAMAVSGLSFNSLMVDKKLVERRLWGK